MKLRDQGGATGSSLTPIQRAPAGADWINSPTHTAKTRSKAKVARVLLLTSSLGFGHMRAAQAIEQALRRRHPKVTVTTLDFWSLMDHKVAWAIRDTYLRLVQEYPDLYDSVYQLNEGTWRAILESGSALPPEMQAIIRLLPDRLPGDVDLPDPSGSTKSYPTDRALLKLLSGVLMTRSKSANNPVTRLILVQRVWRRLLWRFTESVRSCQPDVIIATQMLPAAIMSQAKMNGSIDVPTVGVVTDFGVHDFWVQEGIDHYCLGHESFADLRAQGLPPERVSNTGIPLMPGFDNLPERAEARHRLGLNPQSPVVLIAGGGLGLGVAKAAESLLRACKRCQILVCVGQNEQAASALQALAAQRPDRMRLVRWTENMEKLICAADIVVGKPGGLTLAEALACGRPLIATQSLQGQEGFNVHFMEELGVGALVLEGRLPSVLYHLLDDPQALADMQARAARVGSCFGARRIAELAGTLVAHSQKGHSAEANG